MKRTFGLIIIFWLCAFCAKKPEPTPAFTIKTGVITGISIVDSIAVGQETQVTVNFGGGQLCDEADHIERKQVGNAITIKAFYKHPNDVPCLDQPVQLQLKFPFKTSQMGQFIFKSNQDSNVADTLIVF